MDPAQSILDGSCSPLLSAGATCFRISEILTGDMSCSPSFWWSSETGPGSKTKVQACLSEPYCAVSLIFGERRKLSEFGVPSLRITTSVEAPYILRRSSDVGARVVVVATASRQQIRTRMVAQFIILVFGSASRNELVKLLVTLTGEVASRPKISPEDGSKSDSTSKVWLGVFGVCSRPKFGLNG